MSIDESTPGVKWCSRGFYLWLCLLLGGACLAAPAVDVYPGATWESRSPEEAGLLRDKLSALGLETKANTPAEFAAFIREEVPKWAKAVKDSGAKAD